MGYHEFWQELSTVYEVNEAKAVARLVFEKCLGLSLTQIYADSAAQIIIENQSSLHNILKRLLQMEPVQYVLGKADFYGREFVVSSGVLIPRPETEDLIRYILTETKTQPLAILDCCTGSGCIAITLSLEIEKSNVSAFDISEKALTIARENAKRLKAKVNFFNADALCIDETIKTHEYQTIQPYDIIISNPPYVCESERAEMQAHVLNHEPAEALFVPDNNPLKFYNAISDFATTHLYKGGLLCFEINPLFSQQIANSLEEKGFSDVNIKKDQFGKNRFAFAKFLH